MSGLSLTNIDTIRILIRYEHDAWTRIDTHKDNHISKCIFTNFLGYNLTRLLQVLIGVQSQNDLFKKIYIHVVLFFKIFIK